MTYQIVTVFTLFSIAFKVCSISHCKLKTLPPIINQVNLLKKLEMSSIKHLSATF